MPVSWWQICFNPSFPYRWVHMVLAAYLATAFCVGAFHLLRNRGNEIARLMFSMAMWMAVIVMPIQILAATSRAATRSPWSVFGQLRTAQSVSPIALPEATMSCAVILVIYVVVFGAGIRYLLHMMAAPPSGEEPARRSDLPIRSQGINPVPVTGKRLGGLGLPAE